MDTRSPRFDPTRRHLLAAAGALPLSAALSGLAGNVAAATTATASTPARGLQGLNQAFEIAGCYLNGAYMHPVSRAAAQAQRGFLDARLMNAGADKVDMGGDRERAMAALGRLLHADRDELAWIPSTMFGENLVLNGLGIPHSRQRVVTDAYHFNGSLFMYMELAKRGLDVQVVRPHDNRIRLEDLDKAITPGTRLVALTLVSSVNGFQHDLKAVCDLAHSRGALVYADLIQAAGNTPIDLHGSGVDFAASSTYKWLMGDFGLGVMYARRASQDALRQMVWGYRQEGETVSHILPFDPPGEPPLETQAIGGLAGKIEVGTLNNSAAAALATSLELIERIGVDAIQKWRQPLLARLHAAIPRLGFDAMTPPDSSSALVSFAQRDVGKRLAPKLKAAGVEVTLYRNYFRVSPSFYNGSDDVERLIEALS
ncbi:aminotransferase class V-fold PLP-dependent enzyme [Xanthomonas bonasiae]|uniref:aminotransferase class V-fold PLP-dependent enzyme n=1 Tax=Xanthomonas bonasiae TaxID=2810351 RepID=UPI00178657BE|nr:aminotransferase class V-fold PLP-dependent enzyme [Xanthomonas surreyensis]MBD7921776.1 aminotransferase class V-fold PLP-dependent enzyme [Xanthomonas surreyensis]